MEAEDMVTNMIRHTESYDHFGEVHMPIWDQPATWGVERTRSRLQIEEG